jgi:hypothetical protein
MKNSILFVLMIFGLTASAPAFADQDSASTADTQALNTLKKEYQSKETKKKQLKDGIAAFQKSSQAQNCATAQTPMSGVKPDDHAPGGSGQGPASGGTTSSAGAAYVPISSDVQGIPDKY